MAACQQIQEQRHDRTENNHADPEHHGMRTADQSFCTGSGTGKRGTQSNVDKGKNGEQFCNFNPEGSSSAPANGIRIDPFHDHEKFNTADGTGHAGHDPKQRNQSGIPQRDADGLSQEEAGINRAANAQRSKNSVEPIGLSHVLPVFTLENDLGADHGIEHGTDAQQRKQTNADEHPRLEIKGKVRLSAENGKRKIKHPSQVADH